MSTFRVARIALRASNASLRPALQTQRRGYADVASDKIQLSLSLPHQVRPGFGLIIHAEVIAVLTLCSSPSTSRPMCTLPSPAPSPPKPALRHLRHSLANANTNHSVQVNLPAESGEMGILAQHVPTIEQLKPGLVEVIEEAGGSKQFFRKIYLQHQPGRERNTG